MDNLTTPRLTIIPCSVELCDAVLSGNNEQMKLIAGAEPIIEWPLEEALHFLSVYRSYLSDDKSILGWGAWIIVNNSDNLIVGDIGFLGKPTLMGEVEIGYSIAPGARGRGYALEAAQALISWAFLDWRVVKTVAKCQTDNIASTKILSKLGMRYLYLRDNLMIWEIQKKDMKS